MSQDIPSLSGEELARLRALADATSGLFGRDKRGAIELLREVIWPTTVVALISQVERLTAERDEARADAERLDAEMQHYLDFVWIDKGANNRVAWKARADALAAEHERLKAAVAAFMHAYRQRYAKPSTEGIRNGSPMRDEVKALNSAALSAGEPTS